ncbi:MAG: GNAT family N-acetyltransferase [Cyanobacteria bacterium P01_G01_bin.4]
MIAKLQPTLFPSSMIRETVSDDVDALLELAKIVQFDIDELAVIRETLTDYLKGNSKALWFTAVDRKPVGVIYCEPELMAQGTWNVLMLLVHPNHQRQGHGSALMSQVESTLVMQSARLVMVETSSLDEFARARSFYAKCGYTEEARIRNFYAPEDDKVVFTKELV